MKDSRHAEKGKIVSVSRKKKKGLFSIAKESLTSSRGGPAEKRAITSILQGKKEKLNLEIAKKVDMGDTTKERRFFRENGLMQRKRMAQVFAHRQKKKVGSKRRGKSKKSRREKKTALRRGGSRNVYLKEEREISL